MKKAIITLIGIGAIAVVLVLGYVAFVKPKTIVPVQTTPKPTITPTSTLTPVPSTTLIPTPTPDEVSEADTSDWKTYRNEKYGITFKYPSVWLLEKDSSEENIFGMSFNIKDINTELSVIGVTDKYVNEGPFGWFGYCAVAYKNVDQFCEKGCVRIDDKTATRRGIENHGDMGYSFLAYTNASKTFSSICWELNMNSILFKVADKKGIGYYEVKKEDVEDYIKKNDKDEDLKDIMQKFDEFSKSIKSF